ncbi:MAG: hypothetical protein MUE52_07500 [Tabrizicola sp.]|jgi:flagellar biosynthesis/type III secretory pathway protein FliH|nr:hypothetical protein [Tabrizicola sp.]
MIEVYSPDQRLTGKLAQSALSDAATLQKAKVRAEAMLTAAKVEADGIIAAARKEAGEIVLRAERDAEAARTHAEKVLAEQQVALRKELDAQLTRELAEIAAQLDGIVLAAFERLVGDIGLAPMVRAAVLHFLRSNPQITASRLRVAACDLKALADLPVDVAEDAALGPSEAVLETSHGMIDLGRSAQLSALSSAIEKSSEAVYPDRGAA